MADYFLFKKLTQVKIRLGPYFTRKIVGMYFLATKKTIYSISETALIERSPQASRQKITFAFVRASF